MASRRHAFSNNIAPSLSNINHTQPTIIFFIRSAELKDKRFVIVPEQVQQPAN